MDSFLWKALAGLYINSIKKEKPFKKLKENKSNQELLYSSM